MQSASQHQISTPKPNHYILDKSIATQLSQPHRKVLILTIIHHKNKFLGDIIPPRLLCNRHEPTTLQISQPNKQNFQHHNANTYSRIHKTNIANHHKYPQSCYKISENLFWFWNQPVEWLERGRKLLEFKRAVVIWQWRDEGEGLDYFSLYFLLKVYFFSFLLFIFFSFYLCFLIIIMVRVFGGRKEFMVFLYGGSLSLSLLSSLIYSPLHSNILIFYPFF